MKMYNNILVTATNSPYYSSLLTLISNVHKDSLEVVDRIFVFNWHPTFAGLRILRKVYGNEVVDWLSAVIRQEQKVPKQNELKTILSGFFTTN